jgi:hypothetical protein
MHRGPLAQGLIHGAIALDLENHCDRNCFRVM